MQETGVGGHVVIPMGIASGKPTFLGCNVKQPLFLKTKFANRYDPIPLPPIQSTHNKSQLRVFKSGSAGPQRLF